MAACPLLTITDLSAPGTPKLEWTESREYQFYMILGRYRNVGPMVLPHTPSYMRLDDRRNAIAKIRLDSKYFPGSNTSERIKFISDVKLIDLSVGSNEAIKTSKAGKYTVPTAVGYELATYTGYKRRLYYDLKAGHKTTDRGFEVYRITVIDAAPNQLLKVITDITKTPIMCQSAMDPIFDRLTDEFGQKGCVAPGCDLLYGEMLAGFTVYPGLPENKYIIDPDEIPIEWE